MSLQETFEEIGDEKIGEYKKHNLVDIPMIVFWEYYSGIKA